ncbi:glycerol-3-phosphate acyltransferase [Bacillus sp. P14.5]|uniref:glycerol-3-phosphate acyltransferase n=1 Tax=Bacillus sp. P14.5 TaxID=1983400 RepID=UPI000DE855FE|nr:glycerol-3-phosphate acyltransferase [Bacillus sp. P14.5]
MNLYMLIAVCLLSYGFGGLNGAYYLTGYYLKDDIRRYGSGNVGATNAGRILGKKGFILTVIVDVSKVAAAMAIAYWMTENESLAMAWSAFFLLIGHIFPLQLGFRGGKGVVVFFANSLFLVPISIPVCGIIMGITFILLKDYKKAGFMSMLSIPITAYLVDAPFEYWTVLLIMFVIVLLVHKKITIAATS